MAKKIVILEDNADRRAAMQRCLQDRFYQFDMVFFDAAKPMQDYCENHLDETLVIGLDHDLEMQPDSFGRCCDLGTGREVANYLAGKKPVCPIVIHTSNASAAIGMEIVLQDARWETLRVLPADDLEWIPTQRFRTIRRAIVGSTRSGKPVVPSPSAVDSEQMMYSRRFSLVFWGVGGIGFHYKTWSGLKRSAAFWAPRAARMRLASP